MSALPTITPLNPITTPEIPAVPAKTGTSWVPVNINVRLMDDGTWQASFDVQQAASDGSLIDGTRQNITVGDILGAGGQTYPLILSAAGAILQALAQILQAGGLA